MIIVNSLKNFPSKALGFLQKIGKATMLPVSVLPIAGLLLGIGGALLLGVEQGRFHVESHSLLLIFSIMKNAGAPIFSNLPILFAVGIALGLTNNDGVSSIAAIVGYVVLLGTMGAVCQANHIPVKEIMGIKSIDTGVFGGIIVGVITGKLYERYYQIQLPQYLGFFAGKRFIPIITALVCIFCGIILSFVWPHFQNLIDEFSKYVAQGHTVFAMTVYGIGERLLLPFGLHHIWNVPFFFQIGEFKTAAGEIVHGELPRFFSGDPTAGNLGGGFLIKMFGLPGAAFAMIHVAEPENKKKVASILTAAALTSFLTGITEPIEFSFLFIAPALYLLHVIYVGFAFFICSYLGVKLGYTFSHGLIDYLLFFQMGTKPWMILILGPVYFFLYYLSFRLFIVFFNIKTPGRDKDFSASSAVSITNEKNSELAKKIIDALGGSSNIKTLDACITRIRAELTEVSHANIAELKILGAAGVVTMGKSVQIIFGTKSENIKTQMDFLLNKQLNESAENEFSSFCKALDIEKISNHLSLLSIIDSLGGKENIKSVSICAMNRLRIEYKDKQKLSIQKINETSHIILLENTVVHVILSIEDMAKVNNYLK